ncbi:hypothetical protein HA402_014514 [Bradysia odoriphaga]|nr:hypothetical protein HA402_014514 [Bradysia odoriphaga]
MTDDVKRYFNSLMQKVVGLQSVLVTDRDGIPLIRVANEHAPELAMKPSFLSTFTMATDQSSKLGLGRNQTIICMYSNYQVVPNEQIAVDRYVHWK